MTRLIHGTLTAVLMLSLAGTAAAQSKTVTLEQRTESATIAKIDAATRTLTIKKTNGDHVDVTVPAEVQRFAALKVGDKIKARYYENMVVMLSHNTGAAVDRTAEAKTPSLTGAKTGTSAKQRVMTATIDAIDTKTPSITFKGPNGWAYSSKVEDRAALAKVKVGDRVDVTITEATLVSVE